MTIEISRPLGRRPYYAFGLSTTFGLRLGLAYDPNSNLLSLTNARGSTTSYTYDTMARMATRTDPLGHSESFAYDPAGNLSQRMDRKGQVATFSYDALNRRTGATYADATVNDMLGRHRPTDADR